MTWDPNSKKCGSKLTSLSFKADDLAVDVKGLAEPIVINIENNDLDEANISMRMPGEMKVFKIMLENTTDPLMVRFNFSDDGFPTLRLIVYLQYGLAPNSTHYDMKINISREGGIAMEANEASINLTGNGNGTNSNATHPSGTAAPQGVIERSSSCMIIDERTFICYDFDDFTYGWKKNKQVWFAAMYEGPMPPKRLVSNPYNFDVFEYVRPMNFTRQSFSPSCKYWDEEYDNFTGRFSDEGVEVGDDLCMYS